MKKMVKKYLFLYCVTDHESLNHVAHGSLLIDQGRETARLITALFDF